MHDRVFWRGTHATLGWGAPLGKLHPEGLKLLRERGWREVPCDHSSSLPALCWNTRKALDLPAQGGDLPLIRLLPQGSTDAVDDKVRCAELMAAADVMPETHTEPQRTLAAAAAAAPERLWFVKHRFGVKGRAVRPMRGEELASCRADARRACSSASHGNMHLRTKLASSSESPVTGGAW